MLRHTRRLCTIFLIGIIGAGCSGSKESALPPAAANPDVVAVYGDDVLTLTDFEEAYANAAGNRSAAADDSLGAYQDFLRRYVDFRLKVAEARKAGFEQDSSIVHEISLYRTNLARPYLLEQEVLDPIIKDLYKKQQEMIDASHIMVRVKEDASPEDTLAAYRRMEALVDSLDQGADFNEIAFRYSEDPSARDARRGLGYKGHLGYFSSGRMVQSFEDMAYATPVGERSPIFRSPYGYHVMFVHDRRPAVPDIRVAHLMIQPADTSAEAKGEAFTRIKALQARLQAGEDLATLAREQSDDRNSGKQGGDLGFISFYQPIVASFKDAAFALENPGDLSDVIETPYGYHLIQLTERKPVLTYDEGYDALKAQAAKLPRARAAERALADEILAEYGHSVDTVRVQAFFAGTPADSLVFRLLDARQPPEALNSPFATIGDTSYTFRELSDFVQRAPIPRQGSVQEQLDVITDLFLHDKAVDFAAGSLEETDPYFRRTMRDFRDGLLLFKLMEDSVWTAAAQDTAGLKALYEAGREAYRFPERTRIITFRSPTDSLLKSVTTLLGEGRSIADLRNRFASDSLHTLRIDTTFVADSTQSFYDRALGLDEGAWTEPFAAQNGHYVLLRDGQEPARLKTFDEAQNQLVTAYQQILEDRLLERLRDAYHARLFPERLSQAFAAEKAAPPSPTASSD